MRAAAATSIAEWFMVASICCPLCRQSHRPQPHHLLAPARDTPLHYQSTLELVVQTALVSLELAPARPQDAIPRRLNRHWQHARAKVQDCDRHCVRGPLIADKSPQEFCLAKPFQWGRDPSADVPVCFDKKRPPELGNLRRRDTHGRHLPRHPLRLRLARRMGRAGAGRFLASAGLLPDGSSCIVGLQSLWPFRQK